MLPLLPSSVTLGKSNRRLDLSRDFDKLATYMIILLLGPQGSGKGTQGEMLAEKLGIPFVSAGQLLRDEAATGSEFGLRIKEIIDNGGLVEADMITELFDRYLKSGKAENGVVIDSYPRDMEQLDLMYSRFTPDLLVVLDLDDDAAVKRLGGRWMSPSGRIYNINTNPPKVAGICDETGEKLYQREDDKEEAIRKRLKWHRNETEPMIEKMEADGSIRVEHIDASPGIEEVHQVILAVVNK